MTINNEHKKLNVPNLRFPEFQGEWAKCTLNEVCKFHNGRAYKQTELLAAGKYRVLRVGNFFTNDSWYYSNLELEDNKYAQNGDLLYAWSASFGPRFWREEKVIFHYHIWKIDSFKNVDKNFLYHFLDLDSAKIKNEVQGGTMVHITKGDMEKRTISYPSVLEQRNIARFLFLLDERIATQNKIIDKLQSLIKGIVDCTILRKEKNAIVGDVCSISEQIKAEANIDDIITVRLHGNGVCKSSAENLQLGATQYYRRRAGQLIYGKQNFHNGAIGIVPISLDNGITSKDIPSFDIDEMKCNSVYLLAQLQSPQYYKPAEALTTGTGSKRLKEETFLKMPIVLPNKREQDNIAVLIHRASMNLDHAKRLLELLSIQKQFLLRQMFI